MKMVKVNESTLCRICLESGATFSIFKAVKHENSIYCKLRECFKEKIEDINGYPRLICDTCNNTLDILYDFINKFKHSHKLLKDGLVKLKKEDSNSEAYSDTDTEQLPEIDIKIDAIKAEPNIFLDGLEDTEQLIEFLHPSENDLDEVKPVKKLKLSIKTEKKVRKPNYKKSENSTSRVAASILEGEFAWTGENWCLKSTLLKIPKVKQEEKPKRRNLRMKLPRKPTVKLPKLCDLCGNTFKTQYSLSKHRKKVHFNTPTPCTLCARVCTSQSNLDRHMKRKHGHKEFVCSTCGSSFAYKGELTSHITRLHKGRPKKTYECKYCGKKYLSQKSVVIHERSAHTGERPVECTVCFKGFFHEEYLKEHMRLHTGEAPYKCPVCNRGYAQRGNMKSHLRIHRITEIDAATLSRIKPSYLKLLKI